MNRRADEGTDVPADVAGTARASRAQQCEWYELPVSSTCVYPQRAEIQTKAGTLTLSLVPSFLSLDGKQLSFTRLEERLLATLWMARGNVISPRQLIEDVWFGDRVSAKTLRVHLSQLRTKLAEFGLSLEHFRGRGYRLGCTEPPPAVPRD